MALLVVALGLGSKLAAAEAAPEGKPVKFSSGGRDFSATLFEPAGKGPFPALVEIHGVNGQGRWDLEVSQRLAAEGYVTLAVDLYGRRARDYPDGLRLRDEIRPSVTEYLRAAIAYLRGLPQVSGDRIGSIGWCMGGGYTLLLAITEPTLAAGVIYYGHVVIDPDELRKIQAPLLAIFGQEDRTIPVPSVKMFANTLRELGKPIELHIYPDAEHGFAQSTGGAYLPVAAADAWKKTLQFLQANLRTRKAAAASQGASEPQ